MPISVVCQCGAKLNAKDELAGKAVQCPKCSQLVKIPGPSAAKPTAPTAGAKPTSPAKPSAPGKPVSSATEKAAKTPTKLAPKTAPPPAAPIDTLGGILDDMGVAAAPIKHEIACPKCGAGMKEGAILCVACGFNTKTGKQIASSSDGAALAKREAYFEQQAAKAEAQQAKVLAGGVTSGGVPVKASKPGAELSTIDYVFCVLCGGIATIVSIIYCVTGNPKGPTMLKINLIAQAILFALGFAYGMMMGSQAPQ